MNKIKKKKVYKVIFELKSPLSIGSGNNNQTDRDIIKNSLGIPYIPGSAIAGIGRETARKLMKNLGREEQEKKYFGDISNSEKERNIFEKTTTNTIININGFKILHRYPK